ncbi:Type I restriction-modification system, specificity subunit S [Methanosarcina siciliae C2J]|uniref:Type I restriction-modification system, specificity subunit S n=1 Tax=Methanosarcina siciliae C2J TaxID=1434118 RepID=A0A0E3LDB8_9EURY|nr:restriction endonuclease subunit S [Methanosarcina siciliae]AKB36996.1 Type I restriction-modification system, specificity subunit S [Methanosarcina siciliae C2J]
MIRPELARYDVHKNIKNKWIAEIPNHWELSRIKDRGSVKARIGWKALKASEYVDDGFVLISTPNIKNKDIDFENVNYITYERYVESPEIMLKEDDILLAKDGSTLGIVNIVTSLPRETTVNSSICVLRFNKTIFNKYLFYQIESKYIQDQIQYNKGGMGVPHLFQQDINNFIILVPQFSEQKAIANYLDTKTSHIDRKIDLLIQKSVQYLKLKKSIITETVTSGLDKNVAVKDSGVEWIGKVPKHWDVKRLKDIGNSIIGITYSPEDVLDDKFGGVLVLRSSNIQNNRLSLSDTVYVGVKVSRKQTLRKGDILLCSRNGSRSLIGKNICIDERTEGQTFGAFMTVYRTKYFRFIQHFFNSQLFESQSGLYMSSTINQLTINTLNNFLIALPPIPEQEDIADYLDTKTAHIDHIIETTNNQIDKLRELRKTLINDVVTGKIKVV